MLSRDEAIKIVKEKEHKSYSRCVCEFCGYNESRFWEILDFLYNKELFQKNLWRVEINRAYLGKYLGKTEYEWSTEMFELDKFISEYVTKRESSMFQDDIEENRDILADKIEGKSVLVIGGAGSIGSSFIRAILEFNPNSLVVVDINENGLAELTRDLRSSKNIRVPKDYVTYPMDFASNVFKKMFCERRGFDIVANFSAHKHVRSEKDIYSIETMIRNNVINAKKLLDLLEKYPPEEYFCVSTDKAANPVNIMGASKRLMEDVIFSYSDKFDVKTARFANVAFSNGSLPAGFLERVAKRQPLSAPLDIKRYFVSPEESGQICMLACILGGNREIFYPKLNEAQMMGFDVIAENVLVEHGYKVLKCNSELEAIEHADNLKKNSIDYPVYFSTSDTSGEKKYEEFFTSEEKLDENRLKALGIIVGKEIPDKTKIQSVFERLELIFEKEKCSKEDIVNIFKEAIPNFMHIEKDKSLDSKM